MVVEGLAEEVGRKATKAEMCLGSPIQCTQLRKEEAALTHRSPPLPINEEWCSGLIDISSLSVDPCAGQAPDLHFIHPSTAT